MTRVVPALTAAAFTTAALAQLRSRPRAELERTNFRGSTVSLAGGLAAALGALTGVAGSGGAGAVAGVLAVAPAAALGALDDLTERPEARSTKGLRGHLGALRSGTVTTGFVKLAGITTAGLAAGAVLAAHRGRLGSWAGFADAATSGALIAGSANLLNLLDLRPGRALKVAGLVAAPLTFVPGASGDAAAGVVGAVGASLPSDLAETTMLGDTGANALGAALGVALAGNPSVVVRLVALGTVVAGTLASERVSFSAVIARTPVLRAVDDAGRLPAPG